MKTVFATNDDKQKIYTPFHGVTIIDNTANIFDSYEYQVVINGKKYEISKVDYDQLLSAMFDRTDSYEIIMITLKEEIL